MKKEENPSMNYDVVVIGAGPVGSTAARSAAMHGARVLLLEEHASIGSPVSCTGLLSTQAVAECGVRPSEDFVLNSVRGAFVHAPDGQNLQIDGKKTKAYVVSRKIFDRKVAGLATEAGVEFSLRTRFVGLERDFKTKTFEEKTALKRPKPPFLKLQVLRNGKLETINAGVVIGADGVKSRVAEYAGLGKPERVLSGVQIEAIYASKDSDFVELFPGSFAPGFFAWTVPLNEKVSRIGLAVEPKLLEERKCPLFYLEKFLHSNIHVKSRYRGGMLDFVVGGIPIDPLKKTYADGILIAGDAAGQAKPTSGGGVYPGAFAAKIAGKVAAEAALEGDVSASRLSEYDKAWRKSLGKELEIGLKIHDYVGKLEDRQLNSLIGSLNSPEILNIITEYGDMDHPSVLLKKLLLSGNSLQLMKAFGTFARSLF